MTIDQLLIKARQYKETQESDYLKLSANLETFATDLRIIELDAPEHMKGDINSRIENILETREIILAHKLGQLPFWEQMVAIEKLAEKCLSIKQDGMAANRAPPFNLSGAVDDSANQAARQQIGQRPKLAQLFPPSSPRGDESKEASIHRTTPRRDESLDAKIAALLRDYYHNLFDLLKKMGKIQQSMIEKLPLPGKSKFLINEYLNMITDLIAVSNPDKKLINSWVEIYEKFRTDPAKSIEMLEGAIKAMEDDSPLIEPLTKDELVAELKKGRKSSDVKRISTLLSSKTHQLTAKDKVEILKLGIKKAEITTFELLFKHEGFSGLTNGDYEELIDYSLQQEAYGHFEVINESEVYKLSRFEMSSEAIQGDSLCAEEIPS